LLHVEFHCGACSQIQLMNERCMESDKQETQMESNSMHGS
jgi:hypothetical protein